MKGVLSRVCVVVLFIISVPSSLAQNNENFVDNATLVALWDEGDYEMLLAELLVLQVELPSHATLYRNLGDVYWQVDQRGEAMLAWRSAQVLAPDADLNARITQARLIIGDEESYAPTSLIALSSQTQGFITTTGLLWVFTGLWLGLWGILWAMRRWETKRVTLRYVGGGLLVAWASVAILLGSRLYVAYATPPAIVLENNVAVYNGAGDDYLRLFTLQSGQEVYWLADDGVWMRIATRDGRGGWILRENVGYIPIFWDNIGINNPRETGL
jgi:hypothetical protein